MKKTISVMLALLLLGSAALAMPIRSGNGATTLLGYSDVDGQTHQLQLFQFHLIGTNENGDYLIYSNKNYYSVKPQDLELILMQMDQQTIEELPSTEGMQTLSKGKWSKDAVTLQEVLIEMGYLNGKADGNFGGGTEGALKDFQRANDMEETGVADPNLQLLMRSMLQPELVIDAASGMESLFGPIIGRTDIDLQAIYDGGLHLDYDDMSGKGFISDGMDIVFDAPEASDIDWYQLKLRFGLNVEEEGGQASVDPALRISCTCVRRPVMEEVIVKSGDYRGKAAVVGIDSALDGIRIVETCTVLLTNDMIEALANAADAGEMKLRVEGRYRSFDIQVDAQYLSGLSRLGAVAKQLKGIE